LTRSCAPPAPRHSISPSDLASPLGPQKNRAQNGLGSAKTKSLARYLRHRSGVGAAALFAVLPGLGGLDAAFVVTGLAGTFGFDAASAFFARGSGGFGFSGKREAGTQQRDDYEQAFR